MTADDVMRQIDARADPARAEAVRPFFGVVPGGYGEGDRLAGVPVPALRAVAKDARGLPPPELATLLASPVHEHRFVALVILVDRYRRSRDPAARAGIARFYLDHRAGVDNWDLVDVSAPVILGGELAAGADRAVIDDLAGGTDVWDRRIAVLAAGALIRHGETGPTYALAERLLEDPHPLIHKAVGWMLREAGKRDEAELVEWLDAHRARMPRTMLRYALERVAPPTRARLMARG